MAHEIESMFYVRETPWHGLGTRLIEAPTTEAAIIQAGLNWSVERRPLWTQDNTGKTVPTGEGQAIIRTSDDQVLGIVGDQYRPLQNTEAFKFFDPFVSSGAVELETAGSLRGGRRIWVLARIKDATAEVVKGDPILGYFLLSNSHDGTQAVRVGFTGTRVVCANTMAMAHESGESRLLRARHTKGLERGLEVVQSTIDFARREFTATIEQYRFLAAKGFDRASLDAFVRKIFGSPEQSARNDATIADIISLVDAREQQLPGVKGTWWGAYNAVTDYLSHQYGKSQDSRVNSLWFATGATKSEQALALATQYAKAA